MERGGIRFSAIADVTPVGGHVRTRVTLLNLTRSPIEAHHSACPIRVLVFEGPSRTNRPVWDEWHRREFDCPAIAMKSVLYPQVPVILESQVSPDAILGDSLRPQRYYMSAVIDLDLSGVPSLTLRSGTLRLTKRRDT